MIDREHELSITRQAEALGISHGSVYYLPQPPSEADLKLMRRIDELHLEYPFAGARMLRDLLRPEGFKAGRKHIGTLMAKMVYPYLLRGLRIERSNHVWTLDITYIPMARGFAYLVAVMDWASRKVLAWRLSITMDVDFCVAAMQDAIARYGVPEIVNTDQGSQFASREFTDLLKAHDIRISMDGRGRCLDNVFIERLWKSVKYEEVYVKAYVSVSEARESLRRYLEFYNSRRPHSSLDRVPPDRFYFESLPMHQAALRAASETQTVRGSTAV